MRAFGPGDRVEVVAPWNKGELGTVLLPVTQQEAHAILIGFIYIELDKYPGSRCPLANECLIHIDALQQLTEELDG